MANHVPMTPNEMLRNIIQNGLDDFVDNGTDFSSTLADDIIASGFISIHHSIPSQMAAYFAQEMEWAIRNGDHAESVAYAPGEVGRGDAVANRDNLLEDPASWLRNHAKILEGTE